MPYSCHNHNERCMRALILLANLSADDIDNQSAPTIARQYDKHGVRTIGTVLLLQNVHSSGVLTKPDTVGEGECDIWLKVINNKSHVLNHGYYITRLPKDDKEMQQTPQKSREVELNYLHSRQPWCKVDRNRLGTAKLSEALSMRLSMMIEEMLNTPFMFATYE
jgi:hypothetical protein